MSNTPDAVSAMRIQRDAAHKKLVPLDTENRVLRKHQQDIRDWLTQAINDFAAARGTQQVLEVADRIHREATQKLGAVERLTPP